MYRDSFTTAPVKVNQLRQKRRSPVRALRPKQVAGLLPRDENRERGPPKRRGMSLKKCRTENRIFRFLSLKTERKRL